MQRDNKDRRDPLATLNSDEPAAALGLTSTPAALTRRSKPGGRKQPPRPSEKKRKRRQVSVTFSNAEIPARLRALAQHWGMTAPDGRSPNISALIEYLLLPQLEAAEADEIAPPWGFSENERTENQPLCSAFDTVSVR